MRLFRKKKKEERKHTDFSKYRIKITGKVMCAYEAMTGKPFLQVQTEDDIKHLFYCSLVINNEDFCTMEYEVFEYLIEDKEVVDWMAGEYGKIGHFLSQFKATVFDDEEDGDEKGSGKDDDKSFYMLEAISGLIVRMGIDPHYVMYDMDEWEMTYYYHMMRNMDRDRLTEERLWTYLQILPHVGKKIGGPEKLVPFPWEKSDNKNKKELEKNAGAVLAFLGGQYNGERGTDNNTGQE